MLNNLMKKREVTRRLEEIQESLANHGRWSPEPSDKETGQMKTSLLQLDNKMGDNEIGGWQAEMRRG